MGAVPVSIILHDIERAHTADAVKDLLRRWQWEILELLSYSPNMSQFDYDLKNGVFWVVTPCGSCKNRRFGGTWRLLHQGDKNR
jgi:hypothetical protein